MNDIEFKKIYLSLPIAACVIDRTLCFVAANSMYADLMRAPLESIPGRSMIGFNPPEHISNVRRDFAILDEGKQLQDHEIELWDGNYWVSVRPVVEEADARVMCISVTLTNITHHMQKEETLHQLIGQMSIVNQEIQRLSETDALTGLGNRRALDAILKHEMTNIFQVSGNISVLIIDIDYFKGFNDTYGHLAGDDCLRCIAEVIQKSLHNPTYVATRFGGEEFVIVLPHTAIEEANLLAETIRRQIAAMGLANPSSPYKVVTASVGVANYNTSGEHAGNGNEAEIMQCLLSGADSALYDAKLHGRNKVCLLR